MQDHSGTKQADPAEGRRNDDYGATRPGRDDEGRRHAKEPRRDNPAERDRETQPPDRTPGSPKRTTM